MKFNATILLIIISSISFAQSSQPFVDYYDIEQTKKRSEGLYSDGMEHGVWKYWYESGQLQEESTYFRGRLNGKTSIYFESGQKQNEGYFMFNIQDSIYSAWNTKGKLIEEGFYKKGEKQGIWKDYYQDGSLKT